MPPLDLREGRGLRIALVGRGFRPLCRGHRVMRPANQSSQYSIKTARLQISTLR